MKTILIIISAIISIIALGLYLVNEYLTETIYKPGLEWKFQFKVSDKNVLDTITLKICNDREGLYQLFQRKIMWLYTIHNLDSSWSVIEETTGVIDRKSEIWFHPPRNNCFRLTEMVPFPNIRFPIKFGNIIDWELTPKEGWDELEGKTVTGKIKVIDKIHYANPSINDSCWVLNAYGNSSIGNFKAKYYFHEKYGFVYLFYDFNTSQIEIELISMKH